MPAKGEHECVSESVCACTRVLFSFFLCSVLSFVKWCVSTPFVDAASHAPEGKAEQNKYRLGEIFNASVFCFPVFYCKLFIYIF